MEKNNKGYVSSNEGRSSIAELMQEIDRIAKRPDPEQFQRVSALNVFDLPLIEKEDYERILEDVWLAMKGTTKND